MSSRILIVGRGVVAQELEVQLASPDSVLCEKGEFVVKMVSSDEFTETPKIGAAFDIVILCGSDSRAAVKLLDEVTPATKIIDISQAYRFSPGWVYGRREMGGSASVIGATRVANPGCIASVATLLLSPIFAKIGKPSSMLYLDVTGGATIAGSTAQTERMSSLTTVHPHVREIAKACQLDEDHIWLFPKVCPSYTRGIRCAVPLPDLGLSVEDVRSIWDEAYRPNPTIHVEKFEIKSIAGNAWSGKLGAALTVVPHASGILAIGMIDNLLKGAVENAIYNIRDMLQ